MKKIAKIFFLQHIKQTLAETDLASRQRLRLFKIASLLSLFVCIGFVLQVAFILPGESGLLACMFILFSCLFINYIALIFHKKLIVAYAILLSIWCLLVHLNAYYSGGIKNSGNFYFSTVVLTAFILLGSRGGKIFAGVAIVHVIYFYVVTSNTNWVTYELVGKGEGLLNLYFLLSTAVSLLMLTASSDYIEKSKNAIVKDLHVKNDELIEASSRLHLSTRAAKLAIWDWDVANGIITWDDDMYVLHCLSKDFNVTLRSWEKVLHPESKSNLKWQLEHTTSGKNEYETEYKIICPDKSIRYIKAAARVHRDVDGKVLRILGANWDITESKHAEEAIINSNKRYELATKATRNAIWDWDLVTNEHYWSEGYQKSFGFTTAELNESFDAYAERIHKDDFERVHSGLMKVVSGKNGDYWEDEYRFLKADKTYAYVYDRGYLVFDKQNKPTRFVGALEDITVRKKVEMERELVIQELIKSNADLKQFSYITSHNLRAPLSNISGILDLIDPTTLDTHNSEMFDMLKVSGKQLVNTINDLTKILLIKNNRNAEIGSLGIKETLDEIKKSFSAALMEVGGCIQTDFKVSHVWFHKVYLESMFVNLISNAIKYRSPDRSLVINIESHVDANDSCILTFSDNGVGIDLSRYKDRIFGLYQRFHQSSEGQGLGLFIIKSQIEALGGEISLTSTVNEGTTFAIKLKKSSVEARVKTIAAESVY